MLQPRWPQLTQLQPIKQGLWLALFLLSLLGFAPVLWAQPAPVPAVSLKSQPAQPSTPLTLTDLLSRVEATHPALAVAKLQQRRLSAQRLQTQGAFDPSLNGGGYFQRFNSSSGAGTAKEAFNSQATLDFLTRYGLQVSTGVRNVWGDIATPLSPTGEGGEYFAEVKLPLLRGAGINKASAAERKGFLGEDLASLDYRQTRLELLNQAAEAYWYWLETARKVGITENLLQIAGFRLNAVETRVKAGELPRIDATEAALEVKGRQALLASEQQAFTQASRKLSLFLWPDTPAQPNINQPLPDVITPDLTWVPNVWPVPAEKSLTGADYWQQLKDEGRKDSLINRPEMAQLKLGRQLASVDLDLAANELLPKLDALIAPGYEAGAQGIGPVFKAGVSLSVPLRRRTAQGLRQEAQLKLGEVDAKERLTLQKLWADVDQALAALQGTQAQYEALLAQWQLSVKLEEAERRRFDLGASTLFLVNRRERSTAEAAKELIGASLNHQRAWLAYQLASGTL